MNTEQRNKIIAQTVVALSVIVGGYSLFTDPARKTLAQVQAELQNTRNTILEVETVHASTPDIQKAIIQLKELSSQVNENGRVARDRGSMFAALTTIAAQHNIIVEQIEPVESADQPANVPSDNEPQIDALYQGYRINIIGQYPEVVAFVRSLQRDLGYTIVRSVRLTPTYSKDSPTVRADIETVHHAFDIPQALFRSTALDDGDTP